MEKHFLERYERIKKKILWEIKKNKKYNFKKKIKNEEKKEPGDAGNK